jgi:hypothetical protein
MWSYWKEILTRSFFSFPSLFSGNWFSVGFWPIGAFLLEEWKNLKKLSWKSIRISQVRAIMNDGRRWALAYIVLFLAVVCRTVYLDHRELTQQIADTTQSIPELSAKLDMLGDMQHGTDAIIIAVIEASNPSSPPTAVTDWNIFLSSPVVGDHILPVPYLPLGAVQPTILGTHQKITLDKNQFCEKIMQRPLETGESRSCWIWGHMKGKYKELESSDYRVTVNFTNVRTGKKQSVIQTFHRGHNDLPDRILR